MTFWELYGEATRTSLGFFWKAGWAFVLGYAISGMIRAFVPKARLAPAMGEVGARSVGLATLFGAASSSCSFAALASTRSLILKGANFIAGVAFMFASTNLVIELGILIVMFLGWHYLAAELVGGLLLIIVSSIVMKLTLPRQWLRAARERVRNNSRAEREDFDWKERITSPRGWRLAGHNFVMDWKMVWEEILIGFTLAGFIAVLVPTNVWEQIFLGTQTGHAGIWVTLENAAVAPFVAAATFIGSMGNIPLATVLHSHGVLFAGVMGFIYSDLMVPSLVMINSKYYGWRVALYIAAVMYVSIVVTTALLQLGFTLGGWTGSGVTPTINFVRFAVDYTFWMNLAFAAVAACCIVLHKMYVRQHAHRTHTDSEHRIGVKRVIVYLVALVQVIGLFALITA